MVNEIKGSGLNLVQNLVNSQQTDRLSDQSADSHDSEATNPDNDGVTLTSTAGKLASLEAEINSQPVVDSQRVQAVKKSLFDGTFTIDSNRVAEKMADFENLLGSTPPAKE